MFSPGKDEADRQKQLEDDFWLNINVSVKANQPELLQGLDQWLHLGLISQAQVQKICRLNLSCTLPDAVATTSANKSATSSFDIENLVEATPKTNLLSQLWHGFLDELSIRWLLFLGIFLVVISSGVLAASQWNNFPKSGQYIILLVYSLAFWITGSWSSKQENLKLTSETIKTIAILLVPINFWAMSYLRLGNNLGEWIVILFAITILTITILRDLSIKQDEQNKFILPCLLLLSYLQLGWQYSSFMLSLICTYSSIVAICLICTLFLSPQLKYQKLSFLFTAWFLLLARSLLINPELIFNYGLAIALFAWLLGTIYLTQAKIRILAGEQQQVESIYSLSNLWQAMSFVLLGLTWLISLWGGLGQSKLFFGQTIGISILAIHLFSQRLTLYWRKRDLSSIFLLGLQTLYISRELIPDNLRSQALNLAVTVSQTEYLPESVFSITFFPYVILFVLIASWLYRRQKQELALYADCLALLLGILLTCLSLSNPTWRSLNLGGKPSNTPTLDAQNKVIPEFIGQISFAL